MTVKHWNTGAAAARFRSQAASNKRQATSRKRQFTSYKLPGPKPISNANKGLIHRRQAKKWKLNKFTMDEEVYIEVKE